VAISFWPQPPSLWCFVKASKKLRERRLAALESMAGHRGRVTCTSEQKGQVPEKQAVNDSTGLGWAGLGWGAGRAAWMVYGRSLV
jgi:hypothetical protein